jgi:hypothetical protein
MRRLHPKRFLKPFKWLIVSMLLRTSQKQLNFLWHAAKLKL